MSGAIPPLPQYIFMAWCLIKNKVKFTFTFTLRSDNWWWRFGSVWGKLCLSVILFNRTLPPRDCTYDSYMTCLCLNVVGITQLQVQWSHTFIPFMLWHFFTQTPWPSRSLQYEYSNWLRENQVSTSVEVRTNLVTQLYVTYRSTILIFRTHQVKGGC